MIRVQIVGVPLKAKLLELQEYIPLLFKIKDEFSLWWSIKLWYEYT